MALDFFWRLPTHGDGRAISTEQWNRGDFTKQTSRQLSIGRDRRYNYLDYLAQIARSAEQAGFAGALVPTGPQSEEPWIVSAALARETRTFKFMPAFQAGFVAPVYAAKMAASFQRLSRGRLVWNIITGGSEQAQRWYGDFVPHDERYARTGEFLDVVKGVWTGDRFTYTGKYFQVENGGLGEPLAKQTFPAIYFSGASDAALAVAAKHADVYMMWLEPIQALRESIVRLNALAVPYNRTIRYGIRVDIVARETEEEAWAEVRRLWDNADPASFERLRGLSERGESVGANRQVALRPADGKHFEDYILSPNLWSGFGLLRPGPTVGIVGSYGQVAERLGEYIDAGADTFILAANPHLEEALRVGEEVLSLVRKSRGHLGVVPHAVAAEKERDTLLARV